ncbi:MAG: family 78 glycoside hydrolase catalytic domain [Clostridia bacterium]|nr:family 78 glycoside hydrolase catalytic domain [Clostridia bacterium]
MTGIFEHAKFITTDFTNYFENGEKVWGQRRPALYQHTELVPGDGLPMFAKDFDARRTKGAKLYFSALGCAEIYINGQRVGNDEMAPGWTDYNKRALYREYDVSSLLRRGKNRVLAVVSPGWYTGRIAGGYYGNGAPSLLLKIECGEELVSTDGSWLASVGGPIRLADIWDGEYRDGNETGYAELSAPGYALDGWKKARVTKYAGRVTPYIGSTVRVREGLSRAPETLTVFDGVEHNGSDYGKIHVCGVYDKLPVKLERGQKMVLDLGQEVVGHLAVAAKGEKGVTVKMRYAEFLNDSGLISRGNDGPEGSVYTINLRSALGKAYYVLAGKGEETYRPTFTFFGFRYVELSADGEVEFTSLTAEVVGNDNRETGKLETSNAMVNKLISNTLWGQRGNYLSVPTDCPQRDERLGWTGDAQAFSVTAAYNADVYGFFRKWLQDMRDSQGKETGGYGHVNPRVGCCNGENASAWADAGVIIPYNMYRMFGDKTIVEEHFASMEKYINGLLEARGLAGAYPVFGDWLAYDKCSNEFISSVYFIRDLELMAYMSAEIGKPGKARKYAKLREDALAYFRKTFMRRGKLKGDTQTEKVLCLAFGIVTGKDADAMAKALAKQIAENGDRLSTGFLGSYTLCPALSSFGQDKTAYDLLLQRNEPSWLYSIDQGATTIWERWNSYTKATGFGHVGMNSFNHYAYGSVVEWIYRFSAGIEPLEPGFRSILLRPTPDTRTDAELPEGQERVTWVKAEYDSAAGLIKSAWSTEDGFVYDCAVPEGAVARLELPVFADTFTVNGVEHKGKDCETVNGRYVINLAPGEYEITQ